MNACRRFVRTAAVPVLFVFVLNAPGQIANAGSRHHRFRNEMFGLVNQTRSAHGLRSLRLNAHLSREAWRHSVAMGRRFLLFHTSSADMWNFLQPYDARTWGENVAYAGTLRRVEQLWMQSYEHRVNLLNPAFRNAAVGVVRAKGWLWVTLQLYG